MDDLSRHYSDPFSDLKTLKVGQGAIDIAEGVAEMAIAAGLLGAAGAAFEAGLPTIGYEGAAAATSFITGGAYKLASGLGELVNPGSGAPENTKIASALAGSPNLSGLAAIAIGAGVDPKTVGEGIEDIEALQALRDVLRAAKLVEKFAAAETLGELGLEKMLPNVKDAIPDSGKSDGIHGEFRDDARERNSGEKDDRKGGANEHTTRDWRN